MTSKFDIVCMRVDGTDSSRSIQINKQFGGKLINFYTMDRDELLFIARHRLLPTQTVLVMDGTRVVARMIGNDIPTAKKFQSLLERLSLIC